ncbi:ATP-binding cassette domain-containing protein [Candidatus Pelagibacter sp.]|nr:ATP-binding cassette domain-containing protein [Candidatus Pelagibacter sp.]
MINLNLKNITLEFPYIKQKNKLTNINKDDLKISTGLKNISLNFKAGDRVGLIGENGAGKTTLLKAISGIYEVDKGEIDINGNLLAVFTLNAGIEDEFTGYQNIIYQMFLRGYDRKFALTKIDEIMELSKLGDNIHRQVRTYSSGMRARLAIAIVFCLKADIFLCDEFITTSDPSYFDEMIDKIFEKYSKGVLIIASHYMDFIYKRMNRIIEIKDGEVVKDTRK